MNERAVAVAKDVLKRLRSLKLARGYYVVPGADVDIPADVDDLQAVVGKVQKECLVCMLGACLLSKARLYDEIGVDDFLSLGSDDDRVRHLLCDIFDSDTMDLMEVAFEAREFPWTKADEQQVSKAIALGSQFDDLRDRVKAVMKNVIANKGKFIP